MASRKEYLNYILEQLSGLDEITHRAMMGEFILYYRGKIVGGIYDDRLLVKPVKSAVAYMPAARYELPYEGAKEMLLVDEVDNKEFLTGLFNAMYDELPAPKPKKPEIIKGRSPEGPAFAVRQIRQIRMNLLVVPGALGAVDGGEDAAQGGQVDVVGQANTPILLAVPLILKEDIGHALGVGAVGDGVGGVVQEGEAGHFLALDGVEEGVDGAVALTGYLEDGVGVLDGALEGHVGVALAVDGLLEGVLEQLVGAIHVDIGLVEQLVDALRGDLGAHGIGLVLDHRTKLRVHGLGQIKAEVVLHDIGCAALAGLGVDADDGLVLPAHVGGVDGQIGDLPILGARVLHILAALVMASWWLPEKAVNTSLPA